MALQEQFEHSGNWLFRWRSYLPLLLFGPVLLALRGFAYPQGSHCLDELWEMLCLAVALLGLAIRIATVGHAPPGTSGRNTQDGQVAAVLNTTGMYSLLRHPLYLGNYFLWLGVALFPRVWWSPLILSFGFWLFYERIMFAEEAFLRRRFGVAWREWAARTPAFIPNPRRWRAPDRPFSMRRVLRREYSALYGMVVSFTLLEIVGDAVAEGRLEIDPLWGAIFAGTTFVYLILRTLKHRTRGLRSEGG